MSTLPRPARSGVLPVALAPLLCFTFACGGGKGGEDDTGPAATGTDPLETPDIDWSGTCPSISGIAAGTTWTYTYNAAYEKGTSTEGGYTVEVTDVGDDGTVTLETHIETQGSNNSYEATGTNTYGCDDEGLWLIGSYFEYAVTVYYTYEGFQDFTWNAPVLIMPATTDVGTTWESVYDGIYEDELGARWAQDYTVANEVTARVEVTVPAGTFTAQEWVQDASQSVPVTNYYANGTGLVQSEEADLTEFSP